MKYLIALLIVISVQSVQAQTKTCDSLHLGTYYMVPSPGDTSFYYRDSLTQKEVINRTGVELTLNVTWTTPCKCELVYLKGNDKFLASPYKDVIQKSVVHIEIIEITETYYVFESYIKGMEKKMTGLMYFK